MQPTKESMPCIFNAYFCYVKTSEKPLQYSIKDQFPTQRSSRGSFAELIWDFSNKATKWFI